MAKSSTIITIPQMVDLALNSPEIGIVNFTVLHSLLHVIVQQMELSECSVEFRGSDSERLQNYISTAKPGPIITLTEYTVGGDAQDKGTKKKSALKKRPDEKGQVDEGQSEKKPDEAKSLQTIVVVEQRSKQTETKEPAHFTVAITQDHYDHMMKDIGDLKAKVTELSELPTNIGLVEALRAAGKDKPSPVLDMFHILTLNKRMDAADQGINKLASMIEDLAKEKLGEGPIAAAGVNNEMVIQLENRVTNLENMFSQGIVAAVPSEHESEEPTVLKQSIGSGIDLLGVNLAEMSIPEAMAIIQLELQKLRNVCGNEFIQTIKDLEMLKDTLKSDAAPPEVRLGQVELQLQTCLEQIGSLDTMYNNQMALLNDKVDALQNDMLHVGEKLDLGGGGASGFGGGQTEAELFNKVSSLTDDMKAIQETVEKLWEEREGRQSLLDTMTESLEILKNVKSDREEVQENLLEKADVCVVNKKVSLDYFEEIKDQLARQILENETKLKEQEAVFTDHLAEIFESLANKINVEDLEQLKNELAQKFKLVTGRLDVLAAQKGDPEAAGTKSKFLKNVNCISCDTKAIMRKEMSPGMYPKKPGIPAAKSMGPYLAYELDQLRKQQKCLSTQKTVNLQDMIQTGRSENSDDYCNRYCGGSHTTTTPQQRVTRIGHFLEQWGPEISPVVDEVIKGTDGKMYKGRDDDVLKKLVKPDNKSDKKTREDKKNRMSTDSVKNVTQSTQPSAATGIELVPDIGIDEVQKVDDMHVVKSNVRTINGQEEQISTEIGKEENEEDDEEANL